MTKTTVIYGPQKGATEKMIPKLDSALSHYHDKIKENYKSLSKIYQVQAQLVAWVHALLAFLDANLQAGIDVVLDETRFQESERCSNCYYREGKMDEQTIYGKTPIGVAKVAKAYDIPVIAICGSLGDQYQSLPPRH